MGTSPYLCSRSDPARFGVRSDVKALGHPLRVRSVAAFRRVRHVLASSGESRITIIPETPKATSVRARAGSPPAEFREFMILGAEAREGHRFVSARHADVTTMGSKDASHRNEFLGAVRALSRAWVFRRIGAAWMLGVPSSALCSASFESPRPLLATLLERKRAAELEIRLPLERKRRTHQMRAGIARFGPDSAKSTIRLGFQPGLQSSPAKLGSGSTTAYCAFVQPLPDLYELRPRIGACSV